MTFLKYYCKGVPREGEKADPRDRQLALAVCDDALDGRTRALLQHIQSNKIGLDTREWHIGTAHPPQNSFHVGDIFITDLSPC